MNRLAKVTDSLSHKCAKLALACEIASSFKHEPDHIICKMVDLLDDKTYFKAARTWYKEKHFEKKQSMGFTLIWIAEHELISGG